MISRRQFLRGDFSRSTEPKSRAGAYPLIVEAHCLAHQNVVCRSCSEACGAGAIRFRPRLGGAALPEVDPSLCNGCADCVAPCPARAIALS